MNFCSSCGCKLEGAPKFCPNCGKEFTVIIPREKEFRYHFEEGKPWRYGLLTAPFDFAITKSETTLQRERAKVLAAQRPYYTKDAKVGEAAIDSFTTFYGNELHHIASKMLKKKI